MATSLESESNEKDPSFFDDLGGEYVKHTKLGVWDIYEDIRPGRKFNISLPATLQKLDETLVSLPYVWHSMKTLISLSFSMLFLYSLCSLLGSFVPTLNLYYSGQLLQVVQTAIETRSVDSTVLFRVLVCRIGSTTLDRLFHLGKNWASTRISSKMRAHYSEHILRAHSRLDVPTFNDPSVQGQLEAVTSYRASSPWSGIRMLIGIISMIAQMMSQLAILITVLRDQPDGILLAGLSFAIPVVSQFSATPGFKGGAWAATCRSLDYLRLQGFKMLVNDQKYRKELVAGDLQTYILSEFHLAQENLGENGDLSFYEAQQELQKRRDMFSVLPFLINSLGELPTVVFTMGAVQSPQSIPVSLASLTLIRQAVDSFSGPLLSFVSQSLTISDAFISIRRLHELINIPNQLKNGTEPYPEDQSKLNLRGISVEFINVSFVYPGTNRFAIRNVSFRIAASQLCVLVGFNGSGKSTILKLLNRLYDPTEGTILIDGRDIRSLRLSDLRSCISVLFQDYTHFPLSIKENIGIGDPDHVHDMEKIYQAANLGGALDMIEALPESFDTFLSRPVRDYYSGIPDQTKQLFGRQVDIGRVKRKVGKTHQIELSGGQMQKVALSRTFMRSLPDETKVGLLLFDEPSASLDPSAEYDLFQRLQKLRGNKTMVFSSHRFGNLTRSADLILYMVDSSVAEQGTHTELLARGGGYAKMYNIQASQFL